MQRLLGSKPGPTEGKKTAARFATAEAHGARGAHGAGRPPVTSLPAEGGHQPQFTDFLIDICRLEIDASCTKHRMAMHSNRHSCGTMAEGAADAKSKSRSLVGQNRASVGMTTRLGAGRHRESPPGLASSSDWRTAATANAKTAGLENPALRLNLKAGENT
jgi:hypothetical protein